MESVILGFGIRNLAQGIPNPAYDSNPESKFHWERIRNPVLGIRNPKREMQNPRLSWINLHGSAINMLSFKKRPASGIACYSLIEHNRQCSYGPKPFLRVIMGKTFLLFKWNCDFLFNLTCSKKLSKVPFLCIGVCVYFFFARWWER